MQNRRNEMDLSLEQKKEFVEFINSKWASPQQCPICKAYQWLVPDYIYEVPEVRFHPSSRKMKMTPLVELICGNCGYTIFFNAILAGIYKDDMKASDEARRSIPAENNAGKK